MHKIAHYFDYVSFFWNLSNIYLFYMKMNKIATLTSFMQPLNGLNPLAHLIDMKINKASGH